MTMPAIASAPLLSRVKSWQLIGLGISGWLTLYSIALLTWGASSNLIGHAQGGCFAVTMTLAGLEAKRYRRGVPMQTVLDWVNGTTTDDLNQTIANVIRRQHFSTEKPHLLEAEMGFGVRAVKDGRTIVFETGRWKEPVVDLPHVQSTEANRREILADLAIIVSAGAPDEESKKFVDAHPLQLLAGNELKSLLKAEKTSASKI